MVPPVRMCRVCRARKPKADLTRWVRTAEGLEVDRLQRLAGRGFYTCKPECAEKLPLVIRKSGR